MTRLVAALLAALFAFAPLHTSRADEEITVFGAASLTDALGEIAAQYEAETGVVVRLSFASSSTLARQIESGAPAQVFASADVKWMDYLEERDLIEAATRVSPIGNRLVMIVPSDSAIESVALVPGLDLGALLGPEGRIAVGDPAHVPAGIYARQALEHLGLWPQAEPRLARAENVRSALALVQLGETPLGIVYGTDAAVGRDVRIVGVFPEESHDPVVYPFAIVKGQGGDQARAFLDYATGAASLAVFERYGFSTSTD